jgi:hypothetical protein
VTHLVDDLEFRVSQLLQENEPVKVLGFDGNVLRQVRRRQVLQAVRLGSFDVDF